MAHRLLEGGEHRAAFAYNAERGDPWHRMGKAMSGAQTIDEMLEAAHADFHVAGSPMFIEIEVDTGETEIVEEEIPGIGFLPVVRPVKTVRRVEVPERQATWILDPFTGEPRVLGDVGNRYTIMQNRATLEFALDVVGAARGDAVIDTTGVLYDGRRFFAYIDLGDIIIDPEGVNDSLARGIGVLNSHDGSLALTVCNTNTRWVCDNTVTAGLRRAKRTWKAKHTPNIEDRAEEARRALALESTWAEEFAQMAEAMLAIPFTSGRLDTVLDAVFPLEANASDRTKANRDTKDGAIKAIYANDKNVGKVGANGWAAFNAVVEYLDHYRGGTPEERALTSLDDTSWVAKAKVTAQKAVLALA